MLKYGGALLATALTASGASADVSCNIERSGENPVVKCDDGRADVALDDFDGAGSDSYAILDIESGEFLASYQPSSFIHSASLSKLMTLYVVYSEMGNGDFTRDTVITVSKFASREPTSKIGLREGQEITIGELIDSAALKSANDAATALGEFIGGSEENFANKMNELALNIGMKNSNFRNAHGLTQRGHFTTAEDLAILYRAIQENFPELSQNLGKREIEIIGRNIRHTCARTMESTGLDIRSCKTGYTRMASYGIAAIINYNNRKVVVILTGESTVNQRNQKLRNILERDVK